MIKIWLVAIKSCNLEIQQDGLVMIWIRVGMWWYLGNTIHSTNGPHAIAPRKPSLFSRSPWKHCAVVFVKKTLALALVLHSSSATVR